MPRIVGGGTQLPRASWRMNMEHSRAFALIVVVVLALSSSCGTSDTMPCSFGADCDTDDTCTGDACQLPDDGYCSTDADCPGDLVCAAGRCEDAAEGTCASDLDCAADEICAFQRNAEPGTCVDADRIDGGAECTTDAQCPDGWRCASVSQRCFTGCTEAALECADGFQCALADDATGTLGRCDPIPVEPYTLAIVISDVAPDTAEVVETDTPGPDIDYISLTAGNTVLSPLVDASLQGAALGNAANRVVAIEAQDAMFGAGPTFECDPASTDRFWSMGADDGFIAVSFGAREEFYTGDIISVYELSPTACRGGTGADGADPYSVYIHNGSLPSTADEMRTSACVQGISDPDGGFVQVFVNVEVCRGM